MLLVKLSMMVQCTDAYRSAATSSCCTSASWRRASRCCARTSAWCASATAPLPPAARAAIYPPRHSGPALHPRCVVRLLTPQLRSPQVALQETFFILASSAPPQNRPAHNGVATAVAGVPLVPSTTFHLVRACVCSYPRAQTSSPQTAGCNGVPAVPVLYCHRTPSCTDTEFLSCKI